MNAQPLRFWSLLGQKAGDNRQLEALAQGAETRLGWVGEPHALAFRGGDLLLQLTRQPSLAALQPQTRASLKAPWPDVLLTAGRRNEPVARWIQQQSGGRCAIVHVGRPWTAPHRFDLTLTTAQYALAEEPGNIVMLPAPLAPRPFRPPRPSICFSAFAHWRTAMGSPLASARARAPPGPLSARSRAKPRTSPTGAFSFGTQPRGKPIPFRAGWRPPSSRWSRGTACPWCLRP
ncbi:MAG: hypothetical protein RLZZ174_1548 [Pseudomonadota bacterium]